MNEFDNISVSGTVIMPDITKAIAKMEQEMLVLRSTVTAMQGDIMSLRVLREQLRTYIEYLNPADGKRPADPMSYADWLKLQTVTEQLAAARAAA
jgi:hypothetical protein